MTGTLKRCLVFCVILIVVAAFIGTPCYLAYKEVKDFTISSLQKSAQGTAVSLATLIEQDLSPFQKFVDVDSYEKGSYDAAYYNRMLSYCRELKLATEATFVYVEKAYGNTKIQYLFDGEEIDSKTFSGLDDIEIASSTERKVLRTGVTASTGIEKDGNWGYSLSAFSPISDPASGKVLAVVGVDYSATYVHDNLNRILRIFLFGGALIVLLASVFTFRLFKNTFLKQETDYVTGLQNRRVYEIRMRDFIRRMRWSKTPLVLLMIDLDCFKQINDTYGHSAGDTVLSSVGRILKAQTRGTDICARFGGDEFVVLLPEADLAQAIHIAERISRGVEKLSFFDDAKNGFSVTVSIGVANWEKGMRAETLAKNADHALYVAKSKGKNTVHVYRDEDRMPAQESSYAN